MDYELKDGKHNLYGSYNTLREMEKNIPPWGTWYLYYEGTLLEIIEEEED